MDLYRQLLREVPYPIWIIDSEYKFIFLSKKYEEKFHMVFEKVSGRNMSEVLSTETRKTYSRQIEKCLQNNGLYIEEEQKFNRITKYYTKVIRNEDDNIIAIVGAIIDKEIDDIEELVKQKNIFRIIIDALPEAIFYKDKESKFIGYNKSFEDFYNERGVVEIIGKTDLEIYGDKQAAQKFIEQDLEIMSNKKSKYFEYTTEDRDGAKRIEKNIKIPVIDKNGECWGIVGMSKDITERKKLEDRLRYLSEIDILTGLYNRYSFEEKIKHLDVEAHYPLGIIMGDVNGLKLVNDTFGHLWGDKLLKDMACVLKNVCIEKGHVFRWGGDEFVILIPNCDEPYCENIMKEIINKCKNSDYEYVQLSIALGEVVKISKDENLYDCINKVENKLYRQKLLDKKSIKSSILESLKNTLQEKNMETSDHTDRIVKYSLEVGKKLNFRTSELDELALAASLHDIGKIGINEEILMKSGKLTKEEFEIIKTHTEKGYRIINASSELVNVSKCVLTHHERWDGKGYPLGLKGEEIPIMARIISVVDSYDSMTHDRAYKKAISEEEALNELKRCSGTQFDPEIVECFLGCI